MSFQACCKELARDCLFGHTKTNKFRGAHTVFSTSEVTSQTEAFVSDLTALKEIFVRTLSRLQTNRSKKQLGIWICSHKRLHHFHLVYLLPVNQVARLGVGRLLLSRDDWVKSKLGELKLKWTEDWYTAVRSGDPLNLVTSKDFGNILAYVGCGSIERKGNVACKELIAFTGSFFRRFKEFLSETTSNFVQHHKRVHGDHWGRDDSSESDTDAEVNEEVKLKADTLLSSDAKAMQYYDALCTYQQEFFSGPCDFEQLRSRLSDRAFEADAQAILYPGKGMDKSLKVAVFRWNQHVYEQLCDLVPEEIVKLSSFKFADEQQSLATFEETQRSFALICSRTIFGPQSVNSRADLMAFARNNPSEYFRSFQYLCVFVKALADYIYRNDGKRKHLIFWGKSNAGKSTLAKALVCLAGKPCFPTGISAQKQFWKEQMLGCTSMLLDEFGKVISPKDTEELKQILSGDDIVIEQKHVSQRATVKSLPTIMCCNESPLRGKGEAAGEALANRVKSFGFFLSLPRLSLTLNPLHMLTILRPFRSPEATTFTQFKITFIPLLVESLNWMNQQQATLSHEPYTMEWFASEYRYRYAQQTDDDAQAFIREPRSGQGQNSSSTTTTTTDSGPGLFQLAVAQFAQDHGLPI